jgi:exodeoxyribonuclease-5
MQLTPEQTRVVEELLRDPYDLNDYGLAVQTLGGYAGVGKSVVVAVLAQQLPEWRVLTPTGKAAHVLRRRGVGRAQTLHSAIYHPVAKPDGSTEFVRRDRKDIKCQGFLIDEAGMISESMYRDLCYLKLPVIAVGDHGQLPPVKSDFSLMRNPSFVLEEIHRNAGSIAVFASHLREGGSPWDFPACDAVRVISLSEVTRQTVLGVDQILCAKNSTRQHVNAVVRRWLGRDGSIEVGDRIMCLQNRKASGLFNGMCGVVRAVHDHDVLDYESDGVSFLNVHYDVKALDAKRPEIVYGNTGGPVPLAYSYAATVHKFRGSEVDSLLVQEERCGDLWPHERWAYTAASRARRQLTWLAEDPPPRPTVRVVKGKKRRKARAA